MPNVEISTVPTGRSPDNKYYFGELTSELDLTRPKYNKIGKDEDFEKFFDQITSCEDLDHIIYFTTCGIRFRFITNDYRHAQFVRNMFTDEDWADEESWDWTICHSTSLNIEEPKIYINLDSCDILIAGTTFMGEIKKSVFGVVSFLLPKKNILPMHCSAFTFAGTTNLMFGLSGTGKTTLSSDPDFMLIGDDEIAWHNKGIEMIETGCYAKSEGLTPDTHETIFNAVEKAKDHNTLVIENPGVPNARLSYPLHCVENAYHQDREFNHPNNIFFLTMDAKGVFPSISKITGDTVKRFFETGYTSQMPGTEAGTDEIKPLFSPCYGSPFMPRAVSEYSDLLMKKIDEHKCNVYLVNTGMDKKGVRFPLDFTRRCVKIAITEGAANQSTACLAILEELINAK